METPKITPRSEWPNLSVDKLYEVKNSLENRYYDMRNINEGYALQIRALLDQANYVLQAKELEQLLESERQKAADEEQGF